MNTEKISTNAISASASDLPSHSQWEFSQLREPTGGDEHGWILLGAIGLPDILQR